MLTEDQRILSQEVFLRDGPTPRLCIDYVKDPHALEEHRDTVMREISHLTMDDLFSTVRMGETLDADLSHSIFLVKRQNVDNLHKFTIEPISPYVRQLLKKELMNAEWKERLQAYRLTTRVKNSRFLAGLFFESLAQLQLQDMVSLNLVPMELRASERGNDKWESQTISSTSTANPYFWIKFKPTDTVEYDRSEPSELQANVLYVPMSSHQVGFDSFVLVGRYLYLFQFLIAASHDIKEGTVTFLSQPALETLREAEWRFVFVVPPGSGIVCPQSNMAKLETFWTRTSFFTAEIDIEKQVQSQDDGSVNINPNESSHSSPSCPHQTRSSTSRSAQKRKARAVPLTEATSCRQTRSSTKRSAQKRKAQDVPPTDEATSSKALPSRHKVLNTGE